ncbi:hypothetical protein BKA80DRAFT_260201 [Phyllosticta citrichinensis]
MAFQEMSWQWSDGIQHQQPTPMIQAYTHSTVSKPRRQSHEGCRPKHATFPAPHHIPDAG